MGKYNPYFVSCGGFPHAMNPFNPEVCPGRWEGCDPPDPMTDREREAIMRRYAHPQDAEPFTAQEFTALAIAISTAVRGLDFTSKTIDEAYGLIYTAISQKCSNFVGREYFHGSFKSLRWRLNDQKWMQFMKLFRHYAFTPKEYENLELSELDEMRINQEETRQIVQKMNEVAKQSEELAVKIQKVEQELDGQEGEQVA